jgi:hypothetical protein
MTETEELKTVYRTVRPVDRNNHTKGYELVIDGVQISMPSTLDEAVAALLAAIEDDAAAAQEED